MSVWIAEDISLPSPSAILEQRDRKNLENKERVEEERRRLFVSKKKRVSTAASVIVVVAVHLENKIRVCHSRMLRIK